MKWDSRLTVDMSLEEHTYLKIASAILGMSMRKFVLLAFLEKIQQINDGSISEKAKSIVEKYKNSEELSMKGLS